MTTNDRQLVGLDMKYKDRIATYRREYGAQVRNTRWPD